MDTLPSLSAIADQIENQKLPPIEKWNPEFTGDLDMRIARDGRWFHEGSEIKRKPLVKLFSTILLRQGPDYFLITPVEKYRIQVEDAPFVAVSAELREQNNQPCLVFKTNVDDWVVLDKTHPLRVETDPVSAEPTPYILVRNNLEALVSRNVFYQLVDQAEVVEGHSNELFVNSAGERFSLGTF